MKAIKRKFNWFALCMLVIMVSSACVPKVKTTSPEENPTPEPLAEDQKYMLVSGSKFLMGSEKGDPLSREDEYPQHEVILSSFFIMKREVTNAEYRSCMDAGVCTPPLEEEGPTSFFMDPNFNDWPMTGVDWFQAQLFCEWTDGRLPTEAEWEKAARGRAGGTFPWGDEQPNCDLANSVECQEETNTVRVLSHPQGESPYKLTETAGNVREWTSDWYLPDFYTDEVVFAPFGPNEGELKVTRGGAWTDGVENLRAAARMPMDPLEQNEMVGFRCVAVGKSVAPVCQNTYRNFCEDPRIPRKPGDEPCIPEEESGDCGGTSIASFGCPDDDLVTVSFAVPTEGEVNVNIGTAGFDCEAGDGVMYCTGPAPRMGSEVTVTVCGAPPPPVETEAVSAELNISSIVLARILNPVLVSLAAQEKLQHFGFCPDGYEMDTDSGDCVKLEERQPCPEDWSPDTKMDVDSDEEVLICVPDGPESCPENSQYDLDAKECRLLDLGVGCPVGFETNLEKELCTPPARRLNSCLPGYWMDGELDCCVPMENPCEQGEYIETRIDECLESGPGGCPACTYLDEYEGCIPIPGCEPGRMDSLPGINSDGGSNEDPASDNGPTERTNLAQLPEGMGALQPDCLPDHTDEQGNCSPPENDGAGECGEGYVVARDLETEQMTCLPSYGPGSGCPRGYIMDPRVNCCVPLSNPCPDPEGGENPFFAANFFDANPFNDVVFGDTNFNQYGGGCENSEGGEEGCPPGTYMNNDGGCEDETGGGSVPVDCPYGCWPDYNDPRTCQCENDPAEDFTCPEGECWLTDTGLNQCQWICGDPDGEFNPCDSDDQVWIPEQELCVPRGDDCCPPGYDWSTTDEECLPIFQQGFALMPNLGEIVPEETDTECSEGYEFVDGTCMLSARRGGDRCCWTTVVTVPLCVGPCRIGLQYNVGTGACETPKPKAAPASGGGTTAPAPAPACTCSPTDCNMIGNPCYGRNPCC